MLSRKKVTCTVQHKSALSSLHTQHHPTAKQNRFGKLQDSSSMRGR
jgi:hypothetical protein